VQTRRLIFCKTDVYLSAGRSNGRSGRGSLKAKLRELRLESSTFHIVSEPTKLKKC